MTEKNNKENVIPRTWLSDYSQSDKQGELKNAITKGMDIGEVNEMIEKHEKEVRVSSLADYSYSDNPGELTSAITKGMDIERLNAMVNEFKSSFPFIDRIKKS